MLRRVLFPTDFSEPANRLLECLGAFRPLSVEEVVRPLAAGLPVTRGRL